LRRNSAIDYRMQLSDNASPSSTVEGKKR
jgi:hypothetical protein